MFDNCEIAAQVPEVLSGLPGRAWRCCYRRAADLRTVIRRPGFIPQYKGSRRTRCRGYGIRVSGTLQSCPVRYSWRRTFTTTTTDDVTTLGRPFTLAQANANLIAPGTELGDRLNQIDLRLTKIVNVGKGRVDFNVDFFNAFNSDAVITEISAFGPAYRRPTTVIQPRFVKFGARWDF
jgi:hypothetical protein